MQNAAKYFVSFLLSYSSSTNVQLRYAEMVQHYVTSPVSFNRSPTPASSLCIVTGVECSTVVVQDHWRLFVSCHRCERLDRAATGDHVTVIIAHIQARIEDRTVLPIL